MAKPRDVIAVMELHAEKYPSTLGTDVLRHSQTDEANQPSYEGGFHDGRIESFGTIERGISSVAGDHWLAKASISFDDQDRLWRIRKDQESTKYTDGRDVIVKVYSPEDRAGAQAATVRFRAKVRNIDLEDGLTGTIELEENIGSEFGPSYLDRKLMLRKFRREMFEDVDAELLDQIIPIIGGEVSDKNSKDRQGNLAEHGLCPGFFPGMRLITSEGEVSTPTTSQTLLAPPPAPTYELIGDGGNTSWDFACVVRTKAGGKTTIGAYVTIPNLPANGSFTPTNGVRLLLAQYAADLQEQIQGIDLYNRKTGTSRWYFMDAAGQMFNGSGSFTYPGGNGYVDNGDDDHFKPWNPPPTKNTAFVSVTTVVDGVEIVTEPWGLIVFAGHPCQEFIDVFGSDNADEDGPVRVKWDIPTMVSNGELLFPGFPGWPHANDWIEITDSNGVTETFWGFYLRGTRLEHHRTRRATIAANICGMYDTSGVLIDQAFRLWQHTLSEFVFSNGGQGYYTGAWEGLPTFVDGTFAISSSSVEAAQDFSKTLTGTAKGYLAGFCLTEDISVREFLRRFNRTFTSFSRTKASGALSIGLLNLKALPTTGRLFREDTDDVKYIGAPKERPDLAENEIEFKYDWDADWKYYRSDREVVRSPQSQRARNAGGRLSIRKRPLLEMFCTRDALTARTSVGQRIALLHHGITEIRATLGSCGFTVDAMEQIRITGHEGYGPAGYQERPMLISKVADRLSDGEVDLLLWDFGPTLDQIFYGVIGDDGMGNDEYQWGSVLTNTTQWGSVETSTKRWSRVTA